jgi:hypothetical protein
MTEEEVMTIHKDFISGNVSIFLVDYKLGQTTYSVRIWAESLEDAERHVKAIRNTATVAGQLYQSEPVLGGIH